MQSSNEKPQSWKQGWIELVLFGGPGGDSEGILKPQSQIVCLEKTHDYVPHVVAKLKRTLDIRI
jgi:hypothetical protein